MELFFSSHIENGYCFLDAEESGHCVKVLRHREGDEINVIDGEGTLYVCRLNDASPKAAVAAVISEKPGFGSHPYRLTLAVCPTKNNERYEWFAEKATELGVDVIVPVIGDHSERRVFKTERLKKILLSAAKQSLKAAVPQVSDPVSVREFIEKSSADSLKLIAYCFEGEQRRISINSALDESGCTNICVLIGPEGDFSEAEVNAAFAKGFLPVHLGTSRLRTETAGITAAEAVYFKYSCI